MTRVMTVVGTRPEIIRLSRVMDRLDRTVDHVLVHTGQNWDPVLSEVFFTDLRLRPPDRSLGVDTTSLGRVLAGVLVGIEAALDDCRPDALLVLGDTNSAIAALMARRMSAYTMPSKVRAILAAGRALLVAAEGDAATAAQDSGAGFVARSGDPDSIRTALREACDLGREKLELLGQAGRSYCDKVFSVTVGAERVEQTLRAMVDGCRTRPRRGAAR
ncbi:UDP-N-acetylglucosamine 2-epimerase [Micromonospora sp. LOL_015]|uniref:UDP-N-acetylglucosamine 2-epimerase n=1 Tax=Micromonospora sp. LOL_015 TaxID=3345416 RepID=UPI003A8465E8